LFTAYVHVTTVTRLARATQAAGQLQMRLVLEFLNEQLRLREQKLKDAIVHAWLKLVVHYRRLLSVVCHAKSFGFSADYLPILVMQSSDWSSALFISSAKYESVDTKKVDKCFECVVKLYVKLSSTLLADFYHPNKSAD